MRDYRIPRMGIPDSCTGHLEHVVKFQAWSNMFKNWLIKYITSLRGLAYSQK